MRKLRFIHPRDREIHHKRQRLQERLDQEHAEVLAGKRANLSAETRRLQAHIAAAHAKEHFAPCFRCGADVPMHPAPRLLTVLISFGSNPLGDWDGGDYDRHQLILCPACDEHRLTYIAPHSDLAPADTAPNNGANDEGRG